jgi:hypothetical protein
VSVNVVVSKKYPREFMFNMGGMNFDELQLMTPFSVMLKTVAALSFRALPST